MPNPKPTFSDELDEILTKFEVSTRNAWKKGGVDPTIPLLRVYEETKQAILALFQSRIPEKKKPTEDEFLQYNHGYNQAIDDMKQGLEG